jgi:hypothetical protein
MADERMPDVKGVEMREAEKFRQIREAKTVPGVDLQAELVGLLRSFFQTSQFRLPSGRVGIGEAAGMEFNDRSVHGRGGGDLLGIGIDEEADQNTGLTELLDDRSEGFFLPSGIQSALGGDLGAVFRNQAYLRGF